MGATTPDQFPTTTLYAGPLDNDPLTDNELVLLLAIPRGAEKTPDATIFRLPLGPDPTQGWVDVTFSEARSIIAHLATEWKDRISNGTEATSPSTTICLLVQPVVHALFHWLAFWALGCTVQLVSLAMDDDAISLYLARSACQVALYSGIDDARAGKISSGCNAKMIRLSGNEHARQLAQAVKNDKVDPTIPWPKPRRPDPAVILHSSGSTGTPKLLQFSLHYYTLNFPTRKNLHCPKLSDGMPDLRPFLIFSLPYWQSFTTTLASRLALGAPIALAHLSDTAQAPSRHFIDWARGLDIGGSICPLHFVRDTLAMGSVSDIKFFQGLNLIVAVGSALDASTAALAEKYKLKFVNGYGSSEIGGLLIASQPPYTHLRPRPGSSPLVHPISDAEPNGSRQVQFWHTCSTSREIANFKAKGGVPLQFEPFPGEGPHKGEPAIRICDIFKEIRSESDTDAQASYIYLGRSDDLIKLSGQRGLKINASAYEIEIISELASYLAGQNNQTARWMVDGVQLFGHDRPCTALVIQLSPVDQGETINEIGPEVLEHISDLVQRVNVGTQLDLPFHVHPRKRMLVVTSSGKAYGPGAPSLKGALGLAMTHKHTLQWWTNVRAFESWLNELDYGDA